MNGKQKIAIGVGLGLVALGTYLVIMRGKKQKELQKLRDILKGAKPDPNKPAGQVILTPEKLAALPDGKFPIKIGEVNKKIFALQQALNRAYGTNIDADGKYGDSTFQAMCSNVWNTGLIKYTVGYEACIEHTLKNPLGERRAITQADFDIVMNKKA